ncbi:MAG: DEAD/DEAH box helicase [Bradymonadales bacterium]|nr:DEAD/DEAH box helicase [Bradymonadales bacterium]
MGTVLHGVKAGPGMCMWAERTAGVEGTTPVVRRPRSKERVARPHPFAATHGEMEAALEASGLEVCLAPHQRGEATIWLPARSGVPVPSSPLVGEMGTASRAASGLFPFTVAVLRLDTASVIEILLAFGDRSVIVPGVIAGSDLAYWSRVLLLAGSMVTRQRYLPSVKLARPAGFTSHGDQITPSPPDRGAILSSSLGSGRSRSSSARSRAVRPGEKPSERVAAGLGAVCRSVWEPVPDAQDLEQLARLAEGLPPVVRSGSLSGENVPPAVDPNRLVEEIVEEMLDQLVRSSVIAPIGLARSSWGQGEGGFDSVHDQWLSSLFSLDSRLSADAAALAQLYEAVTRWREPLMTTAAAPYRLCFRLEEPVWDKEGAIPEAPWGAAWNGGVAGRGGSVQDRVSPSDRMPVGKTSDLATAGREEPLAEERWFVRYLVQPADDPSLMVPAEQTWSDRAGEAVRSLKRRGADPLQFLLAALGQAAGVCPRIEQSLRASRPSGYELDRVGAHEFLTVKSIMLQQAGFAVLLPAWWTRRGTRQRLTARAGAKSPTMTGGKGLSLDQMVQVDWEVALGGEPISLDELQALARLKAPLVRLRGQWVLVRAEEVAAAAAFWNAAVPRKMSARELVRLAIGASSPPGEIPFEGVMATGWLGQLLSRLEQKSGLVELDQPEGFEGSLRPYQLRGYSWLAFLRDLGLGGCLADDMGLGKTIQALALLQRERWAGERRPVLLICPTSVVTNWQKEAARFTPGLSVLVHHGATRSKGAAFAAEAGQQTLVVTSYALLQRDSLDFQEVEWAGVILDEAQNIKNPETKQARAARSLRSGYRLALTGTPVENNVGDLWSLMEFLNPGFLGSQTSFKREFFIPIQAGRDPVAAERLRRITTPFILRRLKTDRLIIADLPEKQEMKVFCTLTKEQASLYAAVLEQTQAAIEQAEGMQRRGLILAMLTKLKQVCNHPLQLLGDGSPIPGRSGKLSRIVEMLEEALSVGDRALIFTQFAEMGQILKRHLQESFGREVLFLHGAVVKKKRDQMIERFQEEGGPPLFVLSLKAGGTGLNLTRANHVFHFDRWWNPAVENQATDRAFRIGQSQNVQVHKFVCAGTFEEKIDELIERKQEIAGEVVGSGEGWLTEMSNQQIRSVFALRDDCVGE